MEKVLHINTMSDECLAEKFRRENYDQFHILVRMHLSFVLDLNTEDSDALSEKGKLKKWSFAPFNKKSKYTNRGVMEGAPLTQEGICQVYQLIEFLRKEQNISVEGIFRRTGSLTRQQELRGLLNQGVTLSLDGGRYSVHDCASVLKGFLADLPEPLLTEVHYPAHCQIAELCGVREKPTNEPRLLHALQLLLLLLPPENRVLLKDVLDLLHLTASYERCNKMSADNLATLFTPHLLCPRKLSPELLHVDSQTLSGILSFMITRSEELFLIPPKLIVDMRAYYAERERRKLLSPHKDLNETASDNFAANTVYSFIDHERTARENQLNPTETALAQLYAHIQSLPESSKKRKLVKQFNKENGQGTPLQLLHMNLQKNKSLGDSIKKHIFHKSLVKAAKKNGFTELRASSEDLLENQKQDLPIKTRLFCTKYDTSADISAAKKHKTSPTLNSPIQCVAINVCQVEEGVDDLTQVCSSYLTSTPACRPQRACPDIAFTPEDQDRKSMSPITRSTQRMCKAMQESMMTPRSRKPVLLISGTNINNLPKLEKQDYNMDSLQEEASSTSPNTDCSEQTIPKQDIENDTKERRTSSGTSDSLTSTFREYLYSRSILMATPTDLSFSSQTDDYSSSNVEELTGDKLSSSLLDCLNGYNPLLNSSEDPCKPDEENGKELVLRPKQFDENGKAVVFETSF